MNNTVLLHLNYINNKVLFTVIYTLSKYHSINLYSSKVIDYNVLHLEREIPSAGPTFSLVYISFIQFSWFSIVQSFSLVQFHLVWFSIGSIIQFSLFIQFIIQFSLAYYSLGRANVRSRRHSQSPLRNIYSIIHHIIKYIYIYIYILVLFVYLLLHIYSLFNKYIYTYIVCIYIYIYMYILRLSPPRFFDSTLPGDSLWTRHGHENSAPQN